MKGTVIIWAVITVLTLGFGIAEAKKIEGFEKVNGKYIKVVTEEISLSSIQQELHYKKQAKASHEAAIVKLTEEIAGLELMVQ